MLINKDTGTIACDQCGKDIDGEMLTVEGDTSLLCGPCANTLEGYGQGSADSNRAFLESAFRTALENGTTQADLEGWLEDAVAGRYYFTI